MANQFKGWRSGRKDNLSGKEIALRNPVFNPILVLNLNKSLKFIHSNSYTGCFLVSQSSVTDTEYLLGGVKLESCTISNIVSMWNCTISEYSFQNLNEIVWRKSEKFENEAQPSFKFFMISEDDFMKILKRVRGWVQFLINNTTW